jgi:hypothetical protein
VVHILVALLGAVVCQLSGYGANPPSEIKGSETPHLIPDKIAIAELLSNVADGPTASKWNDRLYYLSGSGLTRREMERVIHAANSAEALRSKIDEKGDKIKKDYPARPLSAAAVAAIDQLNRDAGREFEVLRAKLEADLGVEAYAKLLSFVNTRVKPTLTYNPGTRAEK